MKKGAILRNLRNLTFTKCCRTYGIDSLNDYISPYLD